MNSDQDVDLTKISTVRERNPKKVLNAKIRLMKEGFRQFQFRFIIQRILNFQTMYVVVYESPKEANIARFLHGRGKKNMDLLLRHQRIWKTRSEPSLITLVRHF